MAYRFSEFYPDIGHYEEPYDKSESFYEVLFAVGFDKFEEAHRFETLLNENEEFHELIERTAKKAVKQEEEKC